MASRGGYQYLGNSSSTRACVHAVRLILTGGGYYGHDGRELLPAAATLITRRELLPGKMKEHAFIFWDWILGCTVVPPGFTSGYSGEGPHGLAYALLMLLAKDIIVYELEVDAGLFKRLDGNALTQNDLHYLGENARKSLVSYNEYVYDRLSDHDPVKHSAWTDKYLPYRRYGPEPRINWEWLDAEIAEKCEKLAVVDMRSCLAEAFLVLKSRLVAKFGVSDSFDGEDLVNKIFSNSGVLIAKGPDEDKRKDILAMRDLLAGLFKVFRNKYSHNHVEVSSDEADAVLSMINFALKSISKYKA